MSTVLTEASTFGATCTVPADGDVRNAASVNTAFQELANRTRFLKNKVAALDGQIDWTGELSATGLDTTVRVGAIDAVTIADVTYSQVATSKNFGALAATTRYHVYAFISAGVVDFEASTNAPDAARKFKLATTTHRYLGTFSTTGAALVPGFEAVGGVYTYLVPWEVYPANAATSYTDAGSSGVPTWARRGFYFAYFATNSVAGLDTAKVKCKGVADVNAERSVAFMPVSGTGNAVIGHFDMPIGQATSQLLQCKIGVATNTLTVKCTGFQE